jgi:hypothetical protein
MYQGGALPPKSLYSIYTAQGAQCNTTHALHTILHGITSLGSNPRPLASAALAPPPGRSISAGGNVLVGCAADPSGPPRRHGPQAAEGITSSRCRLDPWLHCPSSSLGTASPWAGRWACCCLRVVVSSGFASGTAAPSAQQPLPRSHQRRRTAALSVNTHYTQSYSSVPTKGTFGNFLPLQF